MEVLARRGSSRPLDVDFRTIRGNYLVFPSAGYLSVSGYRNITGPLTRSLDGRVVIVPLIAYWQAAAPCGSAARLHRNAALPDCTRQRKIRLVVDEILAAFVLIWKDFESYC